MFDLIKLGGPTTIIIIIAFVIVFALAIWWNTTRKKRTPRTTSNTQSTTPPDKTSHDTQHQEVGKYPAYILKEKENALDFGYILNPIGDVFTADTSMPKSGACYLVKEVEDGKYEDFDPRTIPLISEETPVTAWFATHWDIVREIFAIPVPWWKSTSIWIAAIVGIAAFIIALATVGG